MNKKHETYQMSLKNKNNAETDYRFSWRWLIPSGTCRNVYVCGYTKEENDYWQENNKPRKDVVDRNEADSLIINADAVVINEIARHLPLEKSSLICVVGMASRVAQWRTLLEKIFPCLREYILLPPDRPRVVVPLGPPKTMKTALCMHRPGRWTARAALWILRRMVELGIQYPVGGRVLLIAVKDDTSLTDGEVKAGINDTNIKGVYALYLGTPNDNRKTVALPLKVTPPEKILKMAENPKARRSLLNEEKVLTVLSKTPLSGNVPVILDRYARKSAYTLHLEYRQRKHAWPGVVDRAIASFLTRLSTLGRNSIPIRKALSKYGKCSNKTEENLKAVIDTLKTRILGSAGTVVWEYRSHGDFAPWNCSWTNKGLFVYDWEESRPRDIAFGDAFYYAAAPALHVDKNPNVSKTLHRALGLAESVAARAGLVNADIKTHFALWAISRLDKHPLYGRMVQVLAGEWQ